MKRPRIPTWLLVVITALLLGGAGALFAVGARDDSPDSTKPAAPASNDGSVLKLPKESDDPTDTRRRGDEGRGRIDVPEGTDEGADGSSVAAATRLGALRGMRVTLAAADAAGPELARPDTVSRVGGIAVPCTAAAPSATARARERQVLDALASELRAAGSVVIRVDDASGIAPCAPQRIAQFERSDITLVLATAGATGATPGATPVATTARITGTHAAADTSFAARLTGALGAALELPSTTTQSPSLLRLLAEHGVVDRPLGGTTIWLAAEASKEAAVVGRSIALALASAVAASRSAADASAAAPGARATPVAPSPSTKQTTTPAPATKPAPTTPVTPSDGSNSTSAGSDD